MLSRRLIKRGYTVVWPSTANQGIDMAVSEKPDIILLDMSLPVVDGWEAAKQIKANQYPPPRPDRLHRTPWPRTGSARDVSGLHDDFNRWSSRFSGRWKRSSKGQGHRPPEKA